ncbi:hypothetical protein N658DRAFT_488294 [Parathielavia hyrcaniae]|uniref:Uncharacterized protein n=1 Tax=Parathielavia hyrcaniae TaxID=113614 RepID=A0AAN6SZI3_9PEZI|nr:hypothetical protein N658DRAFT_488294 [Parathielavia hyrcaniae]
MAIHRRLIIYEFVIVVTAWTIMLVVPFCYVMGVRQALADDIWHGTSMELRYIAMSMSVFLEMFVERFHWSLFQGIGCSEEDGAESIELGYLFGWLISYGLKHGTHSHASLWPLHAFMRLTCESINLSINPRPEPPRRLSAPDSSLPGYTYRPLSNPRSIRIVTLPLPGRVTVVCGTTELPFEFLRFGWGILRKLGVPPPSANLDQVVALQFYLADAIALKRRLVPGGFPDFGEPLLTDLSQFSFTWVMDAMRWKACREPKDRFFSLYGVFQELGIAHGIPLSQWRTGDAQVFRAVAMACFKLDGNLDVLRLSQLSEPYSRLTDSLLITARRNPYDGLSTSLFTMTTRVLKTAANIRARKGALYVPTVPSLASLPSWVPDWTQPITARIGPAHHIGLLERRPPDATPSGGNPPNADRRVTSQLDGRTVEYIILLAQLLATSVATLTGFGNLTHDDPALGALIETITNYVWRSHMAHIQVSLLMALRTLSLFQISAYGFSAWNSGYFHGRVVEQLCNRFPSVASCPSDGYQMRQWSGERVQHAYEMLALWQLEWHLASDVGQFVVILARVLWDFRVSIIETLFSGSRYGDMSWMTVLPVMGHLISAAMQSVATLIGDTSLLLVAWAVGALASIVAMAAVAVRAKLTLTMAMVVLALRACRNPKQLFTDLFGLAKYRLSGAYTSGVHFFVTDTGVTGSTSGPFKSDDLLVMVQGSADLLLLRPRGVDRYEVVGAAYVGGRRKVEDMTVEKPWGKIRLS